MSVGAKIKEIIAEQLNQDAAGIDDTANFVNDLGADSLDVVELAMTLEEEFSIQVPDEELEKIRTVQDIVDYIQATPGAAA